MKIWICGDAYDERVIMYVRHLKKRTKPIEPSNGGTIPGKDFVVRLMNGYSIGSPHGGEINSIFLSEEDGESVIEQLKQARIEEAKHATRPPQGA